MSVEPLSLTADRSGLVVGVHSAMIALSSLSVLLRLYTRIRVVKWVGVDDIFISVALLLATLEASAAIVGIRYGLGQHIAIQPTESVEPFWKTMLISFASYNAAMMFVKLSLLAFYVRLSPNKAFRTAVYIMMGVSVAFGIGSVVGVGLQCIPISRLWDGAPQDTCINGTVFYYANAGINVATDIITYALPLSILWKMQLPVVQKIGLCVVLGLGAFSIVASIYRITVLHYLLFSTDQCWHIVNPLVWSTIELHIAIFASCIPIFRALLRHHLPNVIGKKHNDHLVTDDQSTNSRKHSSALLNPPSVYPQSNPYRQSKCYSLAPVKSTDHSKTGNQTTIKRTEGFSFNTSSESEEHIVIPQQGILAHTSVHVEHEEVGVVEKSDSMSNNSSLDGKFSFR